MKKRKSRNAWRRRVEWQRAIKTNLNFIREINAFKHQFVLRHAEIKYLHVIQQHIDVKESSRAHVEITSNGIRIFDGAEKQIQECVCVRARTAHYTSWTRWRDRVRQLRRYINSQFARPLKTVHLEILMTMRAWIKRNHLKCSEMDACAALCARCIILFLIRLRNPFGRSFE